MEDRKKLVQQITARVNNRLSDHLMTVPERREEGIPELHYINTNSVLDNYFEEGFTTSSVNVIAGGTGDGKSLCLIHLAYRASYEHKILYISCENSIQTDYKRIEKIKATYTEFNESNITYINVLDELNTKNTDTNTGEVLELIKSGKYDMVFLDSYQVLFDVKSGDGASLYKLGNTIIKSLYGAAVSADVAVFITWQLARIKVESIEDIDENDISQSMGIARYAGTMFVIRRSKKNLKNWKIKLIKSREDFNPIGSIELLYNDKFTLKPKKNIGELLSNFNAVDIEEEV